MREALPFALALTYALVAPWLDDITWRNAYRSFYRDDDPGGAVDPEDLVRGASWAVDLSQVIPAFLLTTAGVILAANRIAVETAAVIVVLVVIIPFLLIAYIQQRRDLHRQDRDRGVWVYSPAQVAVIVVNVGAIILVAT